jgi:DNA-binding MarR family transcriptional regulator
MARDQRPRGAAFLLAQIGAHAATRFGERVGAVGLSRPQSGILGLLTAHPGISQQDLAQLLGMLPSRVVALVDEMEELGLIRRQRDEADRRRNTLVLTAAGRAALTKVGAIARAHEDDVCSALTASERRQLTGLLERIAEQQGLTPGVHPGYPALRPATTRR